MKQILWCCLLTCLVVAVPMNPFQKPQSVIGPNGVELDIKLVGDEWNHHWETTFGFTVVKEPSAPTWKYLSEDGKTLSNELPALKHILPLEKRGTNFQKQQRIFEKIVSKQDSPLKKASLSTPNPTTEPSYLLGPWSNSSWISGTIPILVIGINFTGSNLLFGAKSWLPMIFGNNNSLDSFYNLNSYGKLRFTPAKETCGDTNDGIAEVSLNTAHPQNNFSLDAMNLYGAIQKLSTCISWSDFDTDNDGWITKRELHVIVVYPGTEAAQVCSSFKCESTTAHMFNWQIFGGYLPAGTKKLSQAIFMSELEDCNCSQVHTSPHLCHEMGHALGLPDMFDIVNLGTASDTTNGCFWTIMAIGNWCRPHACNFDPWSRSFLGWAKPQLITSTSNVSVTKLGTNESTDVYQLISSWNDGSPFEWWLKVGKGEFFLIENRQVIPSTFDEAAPGSGLLIWHIHQGIAVNGVNSQTPHMIEVIPAGGIKTFYGNNTDTFPGTLNKMTWDCDTTPNSRFYDGNYSCVNMYVETTDTHSSSIQVMFNKPTACTTHCCGDKEMTSDEECEVGIGCQNCKCVNGWKPYSPAIFSCDGSAIGQVDAVCGPFSCPSEWLNNSKCDKLCMISGDCNYDQRDCPEVFCKSCPIANVGNGICNVECETADCIWDKADCLPPTKFPKCSPTCNSSLLGNNRCDTICNTSSCYFDIAECLPSCPHTCKFTLLGQGICDKTCDFSECAWDGMDCPQSCPSTCTLDMKHNDICDQECDNPECFWDLGHCNHTSSSVFQPFNSNSKKSTGTTLATSFIILAFLLII